MHLIIKLSHLRETGRRNLLNKNTGLYRGSQGQPGLRRDLKWGARKQRGRQAVSSLHLCLLLPICSVLLSTSFLYFSVTYSCLEFTYYISKYMLRLTVCVWIPVPTFQEKECDWPSLGQVSTSGPISNEEPTNQAM